MKLYIIQAEYEGIPDDPIVFKEEKKADEKFIELVKGYIELKDYYTLQPTDIQEALSIASMMEDDDYTLRYWSTTTED